VCRTCLPKELPNICLRLKAFMQVEAGERAAARQQKTALEVEQRRWRLALMEQRRQHLALKQRHWQRLEQIANFLEQQASGSTPSLSTPSIPVDPVQVTAAARQASARQQAQQAEAPQPAREAQAAQWAHAQGGRQIEEGRMLEQSLRLAATAAAEPGTFLSGATPYPPERQAGLPVWLAIRVAVWLAAGWLFGRLGGPPAWLAA
jgi:hypothetical protein